MANVFCDTNTTYNLCTTTFIHSVSVQKLTIWPCDLFIFTICIHTKIRKGFLFKYMLQYCIVHISIFVGLCRTKYSKKVLRKSGIRLGVENPRVLFRSVVFIGTDSPRRTRYTRYTRCALFGMQNANCKVVISSVLYTISPWFSVVLPCWLEACKNCKVKWHMFIVQCLGNHLPDT